MGVVDESMGVVDENHGVVDRTAVGVVDELGSSMMMISSRTRVLGSMELRRKFTEIIRQN